MNFHERRGSLPPWRKLLYIRQPYPDNYTDSSFLSQLKRNTTVQRHSFYKLTTDFSLISLHLNVLAITHIVFIGIYSLSWNPTIPVSLSSLGTALLYTAYTLTTTSTQRFFTNAIRSSLVITIFTLTLSPVLKSLSESTSSDSIWSLSVWLTIMNIMTTDYHFDLHHKFNPIFATNMLLADVTVLASRLDSSTAVFCFVLFAVQIHGLFPIWQTWMRQTHPKTHWPIYTLVAIVVCAFIFNILGSQVLLVWVFIQICVVLGCPIYFIVLQKYKDELKGPWDPAQPKLR